MFSMGYIGSIDAVQAKVFPMAKPRGMTVVDRTGDRHGRLTVLFRTENKVEPSGAIRAQWRCVCDCGNGVTVTGHSLAKGNTQSCGCLYRETRRAKQTHGKARSAEHRAWKSMKQRCLNPNDTHHASYGGRGITVHQAWVDDFEAFYREVGAMPAPRMTLERIDNEKGYEPGNVRWATRLEQASNRRTNVTGNYTGTSRVTFQGQERTVAEWSTIVGIGLPVVRKRLNTGWSVERALSVPVNAPKGTTSP